MRVLVAVEDRFFRTQNGKVYSNSISDYSFWRRYLQVFDEVVVLARVCQLDQEMLDKPQSNGAGVRFFDLPYYVGPMQYLKTYRKLDKAIKRSVVSAEAIILRIPGTISTRLWNHLNKANKTYGAEIIGDGEDSIKNVVKNRLLRRVVSRMSLKNQKKQCQGAIATAYVSEFYLQQKYPPGCWSTHYSSIDLSDEAILENDQLENKLLSLKEVAEKKRPLKICHAGTMEVRYKGQDVLLEAVSMLRTEGFPVELTLLGTGRLAEEYATKARQLGIEKQVKFPGMIPAGAAVRKQLDQGDMFVLPSKTEGLPRIMIEAMARALPCIASNIGGIPELLNSEDMVPPADANILAAKIRSVAYDQQRMEKAARRNLSVAKKYRSHELNRRRVEFYQKVAAGTKAKEDILIR